MLRILKVTMLSCYASALVNGDTSALRNDPDAQHEYDCILRYLANVGYVAGYDSEYFGWCEATGKQGTVTDYICYRQES